MCPGQSRAWQRMVQKHRDLHREHTIVEGAPHETHGSSGGGGGGGGGAPLRDAREKSMGGGEGGELLAREGRAAPSTAGGEQGHTRG